MFLGDNFYICDGYVINRWLGIKELNEFGYSAFNKLTTYIALYINILYKFCIKEILSFKMCVISRGLRELLSWDH